MCATLPRKDKSGQAFLNADSLTKAGSHAVPSGNPEWRELATLHLTIIEAKGLLAADVSMMGTKKSSDPYCRISVDESVSIRTRTIATTLEPRWDSVMKLRLCRTDAVMRIEIWDEDSMNPDDPLGTIELGLGALHPGMTFRGWVQLTPPATSPHGSQAGALHIELKLQEFSMRRHFLAFMMALPPVEKPLPDFDIDAVYSPAMKVVDLVWTRFISEIIGFIVGLIMWTQPLRSALALIFWNIGSGWYLPHWPTAALLGLALWVLSHRGQALREQRDRKLRHQASSMPVPAREDSMKAHALRRMRTAPIPEHPTPAEAAASVVDDDAEEVHLGGAIKRISFMLPRHLKDTLRGKQPSLHAAALGVQQVHDMFTWRHAASPGVVFALLVLAALCEAFSRVTLAMAIGSALLLVCSPLMAALTGSLSYVSWLLSSRKRPHAWHMEDRYKPEWSSSDYRPSRTAAGVATSIPRVNSSMSGCRKRCSEAPSECT